MNIKKEQFLNEYKELCKRHNLMLIQDDVIANLIIEPYDEEDFNFKMKLIRELQEHYESLKSSN